MTGRRRPAAAIALLGFAVGFGACRRTQEPPGAAPARALTSSAHPPELVHPPIPPEPARSARPECSADALGQVAARIRETQKRVMSNVAAGRRRLRGDSPCHPDAGGETFGDTTAPLVDRVRICVGQDGPLDAEWNLLDAGLASLGVCADCRQTGRQRLADCRRAADLVARAQTDARGK